MKTVDILLSDQVHKNLKVYGQQVITGRAIPDFRDGLKPVHRRVLWTLYGLGLHSNKPYKKTARTVGDCIGLYHPHGDLSLTEAVTNMVSQIPQPLIDGQGNFGDHQDPAAAMRYTEARLSKYSDFFLLDPEYLKVTAMAPNYSDDKQEPIYLPAKLPNLLINGSEGIAVGVSQSCPSFTIESVAKCVNLMMMAKLTPVRMSKILELKFRYGGWMIEGCTGVLDLCKTGKGKITFVPEIVEIGRTIAIKSICPRLVLHRAKKGIKPCPQNDIIEALNAIQGVTSAVDETGTSDKGSNKGQKEILITVKTGRIDDTRFGQIVDEVYSICTTTVSYSVALTDRHDDQTVSFFQTSLFDFLQKWVDWRQGFEKKVLRCKIEGIEQDIARNNLLLVAIDNLLYIKKALDVDNPVAYLSKYLKISEVDAKAILEFKIRQITKLERQKLLDQIDAMRKEIVGLEKDFLNPVPRILSDIDKLVKSI